MGQSEPSTRSGLDWRMMLDELDEDGALGVADDSLTHLGYEDGDEDIDFPEIANCLLPTEDLLVNFAARGNIDGLRLILNVVDAGAEVPNGHEAVFEASSGGHAARVEALLAAGVVVDAAVWPPFSGTFEHASITHAVIEASVVGALENNHTSVLKILLRAGVALSTATARRDASNEAAWALVDAVRKLGHWEAYVRRHRVVLISVITKMAQIPEVLKYVIADFVCPPGGNGARDDFLFSKSKKGGLPPSR